MLPIIWECKKLVSCVQVKKTCPVINRLVETCKLEVKNKLCVCARERDRQTEVGGGASLLATATYTHHNDNHLLDKALNALNIGMKYCCYLKINGWHRLFCLIYSLIGCLIGLTASHVPVCVYFWKRGLPEVEI